MLMMRPMSLVSPVRPTAERASAREQTRTRLMMSAMTRARLMSRSGHEPYPVAAREQIIIGLISIEVLFEMVHFFI